jgi:hypothetical protein
LPINEVKSVKVQRHLRGLLDKSIKAAPGTKLLNRIFQEIPVGDVKNVIHLLYSDRIFSHLELSAKPSPKDIFKDPIESVQFPNPEITLMVLKVRLEMLHDEVVNALLALANLNKLISEMDPEKIITEVRNIRDNYGDSFLLFRKLIAAQSLMSSFGIDTTSLQSEIDEYCSDPRNPSAILTADTMGWQYELFSLRKILIPSTSIKSSDPQWMRVTDWLIYPIRQSQANFYSALHTHWQISFIDAFYLIMTHLSGGRFISEVNIPNLDLTASLQAAWFEFENSSSFLEDVLRNEYDSYDFLVFRCAPAFLENKIAFKIRSLGDLVFQRVEGNRISSPSINQLATETFSTFTNYAILASDDLSVKLSGSTVELGGGVFLRTIAFLHLVSKGVKLDTSSPDEVVRLMGRTRDLARLTPKQELRDLLSEDNPLTTQLVIMLLLMLEKPSTVDSFKFRGLFQKVIIEKFSSNILNFLEYFDAFAAEGTGSILSVLDENTLSQMPKLITRSEDVYKIRADILEWYGLNHGEEAFIERASQLRLDRKLRRIRGQLDDARLSVDSQRFYDWFEDNHIQKIGSGIRKKSIIIPDFTTYKEASVKGVQAVISHRDPGHMLVSEIATVFKMFCIDNNFGVSSYLGRRIRHGTIRGALLGALDEFELSRNGRELLKNTVTADTYRRWREDFNRQVDKAERALYFKTDENPNGIISPEIDSQFKFDALCSAIVALRNQFNEDGHFSVFSSVTENYCWLLLSPELEILQERFSKWRMDWGVLPNEKANADQSNEDVLRYRDLAREVNLRTDQAFRNIIAWFKKPSSLIPEATLSEIIDVAIIEAKEEFQTFKPKISNSQLCQETLTGAVYYHAYDALSIVIKNAAKHGKSTGRLRLSGMVVERGTARILSVSVSSELRSGVDPLIVRNEFELRRKLDPKTADTFQGKSGIRKLQKLFLEGKLHNWDFDIEDMIVSVKIELILSGVFHG